MLYGFIQINDMMGTSLMLKLQTVKNVRFHETLRSTNILPMVEDTLTFLLFELSMNFHDINSLHYNFIKENRVP